MRSALILVLLFTGALLFMGGRYALLAGPSGAAFAAKQLCSLVFYTGLEPSRARALYVDPAIFPMNLWLAVEYDHAHRQVAVRGLGVFAASARMRDGLGCTLIRSRGDLSAVTLPAIEDKPLPRAPAGQAAAAFDLQQVDRALAQAFTSVHSTLAVAVLHRGYLVAERYAENISPATPLPGWSMAKSVTATLVGILVGQGRLDVTAPAAIAAWREAGDERATVTIDQLLRMTSGVDIIENQSGADPTSRMLLVEADAAAFAAGRGLRTSPGSQWAYTSGSTVLLSRILVDATGGTVRDSQRFLREALFAPLGAASFVMEPDPAGTFIG